MTETNTAFQVLHSPGFAAWLEQAGVSLAVTTYQAGKLFLIGRSAPGRLGVHERTLDRAMGLAVSGTSLWVATAYQLWRFENVFEPGQRDDEGFDALYVPRLAHTTGDVDAHDLALDEQLRPIIVSTRFSCLARPDDRFGLTPIWRPSFISRLAPEDRCHLNGLALDQGRPRYVTACSGSDVADGWRDHRNDGGMVLDIETEQPVAEGLSMPHSPRLQEGRLWLLESGRGFLGALGEDNGPFEPLCFCPGYARGLAFVGRHAVVGLSLPRHEPTFAGLPLEAELSKRGAKPRCGLLVVDLDTGDVLHWLRFEGGVAELYDVAAIPGLVRPRALGFATDELRNNVWMQEAGTPVRWTGAPA